MEAESANPPVDRLIADLATAQHGVISYPQLRAFGLSRQAIDKRVRQGRLHRIYRGVYAVGHRRLGVQGRWMGGTLTAGKESVLSHRSAADLWGLRRSASSVVEVTVPTLAGRRARDGLTVHRTSSLPISEITSRHGIRVTTPSRTLLDLAEVVPRRALERALDESEHLRLFDLRALRAAVVANPGRIGAARLAAALLEHMAGTTLTRSELEERFLELCRRHRLPAPLVNTRLGGFEVDFYWPDAALVVETDGRASHGTRAAFERDRARDAALTAAGYRVVRFTWRQVTAEPAAVAARLEALLSGQDLLNPSKAV